MLSCYQTLLSIYFVRCFALSVRIKLIKQPHVASFKITSDLLKESNITTKEDVACIIKDLNICKCLFVKGRTNFLQADLLDHNL